MAKTTPQNEKLQESQLRNAEGGYVYQVDDWTRLDRFLILGSEGGSYYASAESLTRENAKVVQDLLRQNGEKVVERIVEISDAGRAVKNDPAIFALAMALKFDDGTEASVKTRQAAAQAVPKVCRTFYHLTQLAEFIKPFGGWGQVTMRAFRNWYNTKSEDDVAYQMIKYQNRNGWSHRDILLKAHVEPQNDVRDALYEWAAQGKLTDEAQEQEVLQRVWAFEQTKEADTVEKVIDYVTKYNLPRECVPTDFLNDVKVWDALLQKMPMWATVRNLGKMTSLGLLSEGSEASKMVVDRLTDTDYLQRSRMHPIVILNALRVYSNGAGFRGSLTWEPVKAVKRALNDAFYGSFDFVEPTGKRICLALDVSGSMGWGSTAGLSSLTPREVSAAMAMTTARTEENYEIVGFTSKLSKLNISPSMTLEQVVKNISGLPFGSTDCAQPMVWAREQSKDFDAFVIYTDNETYAGSLHPKQALDLYRQEREIPARTAVVAISGSKFSIADPSDPGMLDISGCDSSVPTLLREFIAGNV